MKNLFSFKGKTPKIHHNVYIDPTARIIGNVEIGDKSYVAFGSIIRADEDKVVIGRETVFIRECYCRVS